MFRMFQEVLEGKLSKANAKLNMRPSIDSTEQDLVPYWILDNRNLTLEQRLAVSLYFRLTTRAKILLARQTSSEDKVQFVQTVGKAFVIVKNAFSKSVAHNAHPDSIELDDEKWNEIMSDVNQINPLASEIIRIMLAPVKAEEIGRLRCT